MNSAQRIAVLCLSHFQGGMELDAIKQTKLFIDNGLDAILICRSGTFIEREAKEQDVPFLSIEFKTKLSISLIKGLRSIVRENNISTMVFFGASEIKSIFFAVYGIKCRVIVRHGTTKSSSKKDPIHRLFYSCVSDYVGISKHLSENILKILPAKNSNVHTIYNSPSNDECSFDKSAPRTFLHVGRVDKGKGVFDAIEALGKANIPLDSKHITFVGSLENEEVKRDLVELANSNEVRVSFEGFCKDVSIYYKSNSFFLFPSYGEGLPNVILEAISNGLSCVTYDNTVFPEFIELGFEAFYIANDRDIEMLANTIEMAFNDREFVSLESNGFVFSKYFSLDSNFNSWKKLLFNKE